MALTVKQFWNCCNARIVGGFGGTITGEYGGDNDGATVYQLRTMLKKVIHNEGHNLLVAITNNQQVRANKALRLCGFEHTPWMSKLWHPDTTMRMWYRRPTTEKAKLGRKPFYLW